MQYFGRYLILFVFGITVMIVHGCIASRELGADHFVRFRKIGHIPVVEGKINGKKAFFIIDTGASVSILDESVAEHFGFRLLYSSEQQIIGFTGLASISPVKNCIVELGVLTIRNVAFKTLDLNPLAKVVRQHENIEIAGILGADFFSRYCIKIDFRRNLISY